MKVADWIVDYLVSQGATDGFGIPGAVVLELVYAMDRRKPEFTPHLCFHEQGGALAACGYAQSSGRLGVAFSTRGPGLTNMLTGIGEAYYDSEPVVFFCAHNSAGKKPGMRVEDNQEIDTVAIVSDICKYAVRIDKVEDVRNEVIKAVKLAMSGRKGPVVIDLLSNVLKAEMEEDVTGVEEPEKEDISAVVKTIAAAISKAKRPVLLVGNGIHESGSETLVRELAERHSIPVLSSRSGQDVLATSPMYFGFVGSHATRFSNFILSKADVIVALGNRLAFPVKSESFRPVVEKATILRVDVDENEFKRDVPNSINLKADLTTLLPALLEQELSYEEWKSWIAVCRELKTKLDKWDSTPVIGTLMKIMQMTDTKTSMVCDVGNHGFWVTNAHAYSAIDNRMMYSGSFGTLGCALPKAIGTYYATNQPVICFTGDQGFQMNMQELQFIAQHKLPITIVVLNNVSSGMIREREKLGGYDYYTLTTLDSGYGQPELEKLAAAYGLTYYEVEPGAASIPNLLAQSCLVNMPIDEDEPLYPNLPRGRSCQDLIPELPRDLFELLNKL